MSLVKSTKRQSPMRETLMNQDPFLIDLFNTPRSFFNMNLPFMRELNDSIAIPPINAKDLEKKLELELAAPGLSKEDFNITLNNGILTISSEKEQNKEEEQNGFLRKEFSYSSFSRSFSLPETIDESKEIKATYKDGILKIILNKKEDLKTHHPKTVKVS